MTGKIHRDSPVPLYEQLKLIIRDQILEGNMPPGSLLPSEQSYCETHAVSRITVTRALDDLEREGFIKRIQGKGSLITYPKYQDTLKKISGFSRNIQDAGNYTQSKLLSVEPVIGSDTLVREFGLPPDQEHRFIRFRRLRFVNDTPAVIMTNVVRESLGLRMQNFDLERASFYRLYEELMGAPVVRNEATLVPITATPEVAELLQVRPGSPHFHFRGVSYIEGNVPVEVCIATFNGNMFQFSTSIYRLKSEPIQPE